MQTWNASEQRCVYHYYTSWRTRLSFRSIVFMETMSWNMYWYVPRSILRLDSSPESTHDDETCGSTRRCVSATNWKLNLWEWKNKRLQLTLPDVLIGLEIWRLRMLSNERGDSVPDLLRNSLDILSLPILKQKEWNSSSLISTRGYVYVPQEDYAISVFFSVLKVFFSFSKTKGTE